MDTQSNVVNPSTLHFSTLHCSALLCTAIGRLATGDNTGSIYIWNAADASGSSWSIDSSAYAGHTKSIEDIQWSPTEPTVFISASADQTVRVWDIRGKTGPQITFQAHDSDVNVISWNKTVNYLLASGSDDGSFKVFILYSIFCLFI